MSADDIKQRVLVIGSDSISQEVIKLLTEKGVEIIRADNMTEAEKSQLGEPKFPVILEDLSLDKMRYPEDNHCWWQKFDKKKNKHKR